MRLALNYSPQAAGLLQEGSVTFDLWKCPDWPDLIATAKEQLPVYIHFGLLAGRGDLDTVNWERIEELRAQTDTPYVNLHLTPRANDLGLNKNGVIRQLIREVEFVVKRFGAERVIAENAPFPEPVYGTSRLAAEQQVIRRVMDETGCGFLLDLSHARMAARGLGLDEREYISALPVDRLCELHITGLEYMEQELHDHMPMREDDWPITEWAMRQIQTGQWARPWVVAIEYGGIGPIFEWRSEAPVIAADVPRLHELVKGV